MLGRPIDGLSMPIMHGNSINSSANRLSSPSASPSCRSAKPTTFSILRADQEPESQHAVTPIVRMTLNRTSRSKAAGRLPLQHQSGPV